MLQYPLIFIHLPKTAGTSLRRTIQKNYRSRELFFVYNRNPKFHPMDELWGFDPEDFEKYKIIMGHFPFSRKLFPFEDRRFITLVRDPVQRAVSYYRHVMGRDEWRGREISLHEYMETSDDIQFQNHQVRLLSGMKRNPITDRHLEKAIENIEKYFLYAGTSERFTHAVDHLYTLLDWKKKKIFRENVSSEKLCLPPCSEDDLDRLKELNQYDIKLHEWVSNRLEQDEVG